MDKPLSKIKLDITASSTNEFSGIDSIKPCLIAMRYPEQTKLFPFNLKSWATFVNKYAQKPNILFLELIDIGWPEIAPTLSFSNCFNKLLIELLSTKTSPSVKTKISPLAVLKARFKAEGLPFPGSLKYLIFLNFKATSLVSSSGQIT